MIELIFLALITFLANARLIVGFNTVTDYDETNDESRMLFWKIRRWSVNNLGEFWSKPVCTCPPCMSSLHSAYIFFPMAIYAFNLTWYGALLIWPVYVLALAGQVKLMSHG